MSTPHLLFLLPTGGLPHVNPTAAVAPSPHPGRAPPPETSARTPAMAVATGGHHYVPFVPSQVDHRVVHSGVVLATRHRGNEFRTRLQSGWQIWELCLTRWLADRRRRHHHQTIVLYRVR